jgi:tRNA(Ile2)-agmatinylcytidine synthase
VGAIWVGIDDTDSPKGGCTTWLLTELLREARRGGVDLVGEPRLVRLNPNIPWKTRGNAALAARFGRGTGRRTKVAEIDGRPVFAYARGADLDPRTKASFLEDVWECVLRNSSDEPGTDPALVSTSRPLPTSLYWNAVREVVRPSDVIALLDREGAFHRTRGEPTGLVGAAAAIAWPGRDATWELIAYRARERWGTPRTVDPKSVRDAQRRDPGLFLCHDPRTRRLLVAPHTPCPILFGLRGTGPRAPLRARLRVRSEPVDRWALFRTNQGSGDHLVRRTGASFGPYLSGVLEGRVHGAPEARSGGHVAFTLEDLSGVRVRCVAFEPTKTLPKVVLSLRPGDRVRVWGSRSSAPTVRLEGIHIVRLVPRAATLNPRCSDCDRSTRSLGRLRGFRCPECRARFPPESVRRVSQASPYGVGVFHPTPSARRHLAPRAPEP